MCDGDVFPEKVNHNLILEALRYWVREYHVDGIHLLGEHLPITAIVQDGMLSRTKIFMWILRKSMCGKPEVSESVYLQRGVSVSDPAGLKSYQWKYA